VPALGKIARTSDHEKMFGPRPLPPHFGEIDVAAPFDPHRFYTMFRCVGANPYIWRHSGKDDVWECLHVPGLSKLQQQRFREAVAWANEQDRDYGIREAYFRDIVKSKPDGDFIHYLGC